MEIVAWIALLGAGTLMVLTAMPWLRSGWWVIRVCDFPRAQLCIAGLIGSLACLGLLIAGEQGWETITAAGLFVFVAIVQALYVTQFLPLWPNSVADASGGDRIRLLVSNLDYENEQRDEVARWLEHIEVDLLVLVEVDEEWMLALDRVRGQYAHHLEAVRPEGLGLVLWSKLPLADATVEHLVTEERPSLHARVQLREGRSIAINALHPTPPGLDREQEGREDSRKRDAELVILAKRIAEDPGTDRLVVGDLNDAAWSHTTRLFLRLSGMLDPRRGRGMFSTYPASKPLLRYPIDHVFVSEGFLVGGLRREIAPGSDHLAMFADLSLTTKEGVSPDPKPADHENGAEIVRDGQKDTAE